MNIEEFEELFGNTPFENLEKIKKYIKDNYVSKDEIKERKDWLTDNILLNDYTSDNDKDIAEYQVNILQDLLGENK